MLPLSHSLACAFARTNPLKLILFLFSSITLSCAVICLSTRFPSVSAASFSKGHVPPSITSRAHPGFCPSCLPFYSSFPCFLFPFCSFNLSLSAFPFALMFYSMCVFPSAPPQFSVCTCFPLPFSSCCFCCLLLFLQLKSCLSDILFLSAFSPPVSVLPTCPLQFISYASAFYFFSR